MNPAKAQELTRLAKDLRREASIYEANFILLMAGLEEETLDTLRTMIMEAKLQRTSVR